MTLKEKELELRLWFSENELYSDGSNIYCWLPRLKEKLEEVFKIELKTPTKSADAHTNERGCKNGNN